MKAVVYDRFEHRMCSNARSSGISPTPTKCLSGSRHHCDRRGGGDAAGRPLWGRCYWPRAASPTYAVLCTQLAGVIESAGKDVTPFRVSDEVFGFASFRIGANAEYMRSVRQRRYASAHKHFILRSGRRCLCSIYSTVLLLAQSAPSVHLPLVDCPGLRQHRQLAVQLSAHFGAEVTAVCSPGTSLRQVVGARPGNRLHPPRFHADERAVRHRVLHLSLQFVRRLSGTLKLVYRYASTIGLVNYLLSFSHACDHARDHRDVRL